MKLLPTTLAAAITAALVCGCHTTGKDYHDKPDAAKLPDKVAHDGKALRVVVQVDGGGIMGITPAIVLAELEMQVNERTRSAGKPLGARLDMCSGTSTGAIISAALAAGVSAKDIRSFYEGQEPGQGVWLFRTQQKPLSFGGVFRYKYKREPFEEALHHMLTEHSSYRNTGQPLTLGGMKARPVLMIPAFEMRSRRSMFFRNREADGEVRAEYRNVALEDVVGWSAFSAAMYFGQNGKTTKHKKGAEDLQWDQFDATGNIHHEKGALFQDGGQGTQNNSLFATFLELVDRKWDQDNVILISLGTGNDTRVRSMKQVKHLGRWGEVFDYSGIGDNQARNEAWQLQTLAMRTVDHYRSYLNFYRFNYEDTSGRQMDDASDQALVAYKAEAKKIIDSPAFHQLADELVKLHPARQSAPLVPFKVHHPSMKLPASY